MSVTPVTITRRPEPTAQADTGTTTTRPARVVVVADVNALTSTNQRGCGNDNPYS
jgi:hypothetical protein